MDTGKSVRIHSNTQAVGWRVWTVQERPEGIRLGSVIALAVWTPAAPARAGRVGLIDPPDRNGLAERVRGAGEPAGVIQLLDRHHRDCAELAARLGVPHHVVPRAGVGPFAFVPIRDGRFWHEVALWW